MLDYLNSYVNTLLLEGHAVAMDDKGLICEGKEHLCLYKSSASPQKQNKQK